MIRKICNLLILIFLVVSFSLVMNNCGSSSSTPPLPIVPDTDETIGALQIMSTPAEAKIFIDNYDQNYTTPTTFFSVDPGTYTVKLILEGYQDWEDSIKVIAGQSTIVNVTLVSGTTNAINEQEPNDDLNQAQLIQVSSQVSGKAKEGDVGVDIGTDNEPYIIEDWYQFNLTANSKISITLSTNNSADFDFALIDGSLNVVDSAETNGNADETISINLAAGNYYLGVDAYDNSTDTNYTLTVNYL